MDLIFKKEFQKSFVALSKKYKLDKIEFLSFLMQHGFRAKYSAMDFVYGLLAVLQSHVGIFKIINFKTLEMLLYFIISCRAMIDLKRIAFSNA